MGAMIFQEFCPGPDAASAVTSAILGSQYQDGDDGPMGAKDGVIVFALPAGPVGETPEQLRRRASKLAGDLLADDPLIADKWGPCGAFDLGCGNWLLFGWCDDDFWGDD